MPRSISLRLNRGCHRGWSTSRLKEYRGRGLAGADDRESTVDLPQARGDATTALDGAAARGPVAHRPRSSQFLPGGVMPDFGLGAAPDPAGFGRGMRGRASHDEWYLRNLVDAAVSAFERQAPAGEKAPRGLPPAAARRRLVPPAARRLPPVPAQRLAPVSRRAPTPPKPPRLRAVAVPPPLLRSRGPRVPATLPRLPASVRFRRPARSPALPASTDSAATG